MRYLITGEWNKHRVMRVIMAFFLLYVLLFWITNFLMYFYHMSLSPVSVIKYYRGSETDFIPSKSFIGLLEVTHSHLFAMAILLVTLTHLLLFVPGRDRVKVIVSVLVLGAGLSDILSGWLVLYVHPLFAYLKIVSFLVLQAGLGILICCLMMAVVFRRKLSYSDQSRLSERPELSPGRALKKTASSQTSRYIINSLQLFLLLHPTLSGADISSDKVRIFREARYAMGTLLDISLCHTSRDEAYRVFDSTFAKLRQIEESISEWRPESDISRLQEQPANVPLTLNPVTVSFLRFASRMAVLTNGKIDITIGRVTKSRTQRPNAPTIADLVIINDSSAMMGKPGVIFDTGAIGKGFALDVIMADLKDRAVSCALIDFGGSSMVGIGKPPGADGWMVRTLKGVRFMRDFSVSTSGAYHQYNDGQAKAHIIDPFTGEGIKRDIKVSVYAGSAGVADALSTWAIIDGPEVLGNSLPETPETREVRFEVKAG
jgi:thiamine biosynthesis lipoprotein ApbE